MIFEEIVNEKNEHLIIYYYTVITKGSIRTIVVEDEIIGRTQEKQNDAEESDQTTR